MSSDTPTTTRSNSSPSDPTNWQRLASADPIRLRDPLAELLGMVPEGDPLVVTFPEVAKAAGHACPAVAGAYRATQLALDELYPESLPVRSEIAVEIGGDPTDSGLGAMAAVVGHVTGAADERGFDGLAGVGGRAELLSFGDVPGDGRSFAFTRTDTDETVVVAFDPGVDPDSGSGPPMELLSKIARGAASESERTQLREAWHDRVQRVLDAPAGESGPFEFVAVPDTG